ncbi:MAG: hypothetical protein E5299_00335 [Burkholderia gladioli]|nr:MAG: hypothetical protein E5299_00335 [Burkholderia gladioli]
MSVQRDTLIQALLKVKTIYRVALRTLQGFAKSLRDLAVQSLPVPNYTMPCLRGKRLLSNCQSFSTVNKFTWWSIAQV